MKGIVSYGSSEDEDADVDENNGVPAKVLNQAAVPRSELQETERPLTNGNPLTVLEDQEGSMQQQDISDPMMGPNISTDSATIQAYDEDILSDLPPMSEKDLLRYLTQPSHSMTSLPLEPTEPANPAVTAKFKRFLELKFKGIHFNQDLATKQSFKNPNLYASLLERAGLSPKAQYASTLPEDLFNAGSLPPWAYKEELLESQQALSTEIEANRKVQSAAGKRTIEFSPASREITPGGQVKRKRP